MPKKLYKNEIEESNQINKLIQEKKYDKALKKALKVQNSVFVKSQIVTIYVGLKEMDKAYDLSKKLLGKNRTNATLIFQFISVCTKIEDDSKKYLEEAYELANKHIEEEGMLERIVYLVKLLKGVNTTKENIILNKMKKNEITLEKLDRIIVDDLEVVKLIYRTGAVQLGWCESLLLEKKIIKMMSISAYDSSNFVVLSRLKRILDCKITFDESLLLNLIEKAKQENIKLDCKRKKFSLYE